MKCKPIDKKTISRILRANGKWLNAVYTNNMTPDEFTIKEYLDGVFKEVNNIVNRLRAVE